MSGCVELPPTFIPPEIISSPTSPVPPIPVMALLACAASLLQIPVKLIELRNPPIFRTSGFEDIPLGTESYEVEPMQESCMQSLDLLEKLFLK
jgi:hypothetical protein